MLENPKVAIMLLVVCSKKKKIQKINTLTPRCTFSVKYCVHVSMTKKEVKMAGYWCRSFLYFYGPRQSQDQYPAMPWWIN